VQALILAGGSGTRFWPLSRRTNPKQLLALEGDRSLLQQTFDRLQPLVAPEAVWVCTTETLAEAVREQLPEVPPEQVLVEPVGRNTAPAIAWSVRTMPEAARQGVVAVLPADHRFGDPAGFRRVLAEAAEVALAEARILTLGVQPHRPETGYGYLELGEALPAWSGVRRVVRFREKPDLATAERFVESGNFLWNGGIFVFRGTVLLDRVERCMPELAAGVEAIAAAPERTAELYPALPADSIDFGVMEKLDDIATLPLDCGWSDLGSWEALAEILPTDAGGNTEHGDVLTVDCRDTLLWAEEGTVAAIGVEGLVVVRTGDAVLVMPKERAQDVKAIVERLKAEGRGERL
jgi:mannose-1-phosphate guanylyltransferase